VDENAAVCASAPVSALNTVVFPEFDNPTIPITKLIHLDSSLRQKIRAANKIENVMEMRKVQSAKCKVHKKTFTG
jgi:hypothetical protein